MEEITQQLNGASESDCINEKQKSKIGSKMLREGFETNNFDLIKKSISYGISSKLINQLLVNAEPCTEMFNYLFAVKTVMVMDLCNKQNILDLKKYVAFKCRYHFGIEFDSKPAKTFSAEDYDSEEYLDYSEKILRMFSLTKQTEFIELVILTLAHYFLNLEHLFEMQPFLKKETLTVFQLMSAQVEINNLYFLVMKKFCDSLETGSEIIFPENINWCFDNPDNPIEKTINKYLEKNPEIVLKEEPIGKCMKMTIDQYHDFICETYDINAMVRLIHNFYDVAKITDILNTLSDNEKSYYDKIKIYGVIVCEFIMSQPMTSFLKN